MPYNFAEERPNDEQLWGEISNGDPEAFELLYQQHIQALFDYGMHVHTDAAVVKDAIQELFIRIWQRRASLGNVKNSKSYLMVSLRHQILETLRQQKNSQSYLAEKFSGFTGSEDSCEHCLIAREDQKEREQALAAAIEKLPARQKEVIYLLFYKNLSQEEAAEIMSLHLTSVYTLTWKAVKNLKKYLRTMALIIVFLSAML